MEGVFDRCNIFDTHGMPAIQGISREFIPISARLPPHLIAGLCQRYGLDPETPRTRRTMRAAMNSFHPCRLGWQDDPCDAAIECPGQSVHAVVAPGR